jgi:hypothetical protein
MYKFGNYPLLKPVSDFGKAFLQKIIFAAGVELWFLSANFDNRKGTL